MVLAATQLLGEADAPGIGKIKGGASSASGSSSTCVGASGAAVAPFRSFRLMLFHLFSPPFLYEFQNRPDCDAKECQQIPGEGQGGV